MLSNTHAVQPLAEKLPRRLLVMWQVPLTLTAPVTYTALVVPELHVSDETVVNVVPWGTPALPLSGSGNPQVTGEFVQSFIVVDEVPTTALIGEHVAAILGSGWIVGVFDSGVMSPPTVEPLLHVEPAAVVGVDDEVPLVAVTAGESDLPTSAA